jgi:hypothetical protein
MEKDEWSTKKKNGVNIFIEELYNRGSREFRRRAINIKSCSLSIGIALKEQEFTKYLAWGTTKDKKGKIKKNVQEYRLIRIPKQRSEEYSI